MGTRDETAFWRATDAASGVGAAVVRAARYSGTTVLALDIDEVKGLALAKKTGALFRYWDISDMAQDERSRGGRSVWFAVTAAALVRWRGHCFDRISCWCQPLFGRFTLRAEQARGGGLGAQLGPSFRDAGY